MKFQKLKTIFKISVINKIIGTLQENKTCKKAEKCPHQA
jgi:hypothetical protein